MDELADVSGIISGSDMRVQFSAAFGHNVNLFLFVFQEFSDCFFTIAILIDVGGVKQIDTLFTSCFQGFPGLVCIEGFSPF